jgi:hypothetical protein
LNARVWQGFRAIVTASLLGVPGIAAAQVTPAAGYTPADDTPSIKVGATIFADFTYTDAPKATDADGNLINPSAFNIARAYINVTGNISHAFAYRITPDITRETGTGSSLNGSLTYRLKYAYGQYNLDDWFTYSKGNWVRFGIQQTPFVDFEEQIYRYRFQGNVFSDREAFLSSSDAGVSFHTNIPNNYGDIQVGFYNGETYAKPEINDQKAIQIRATVRPIATGPLDARGLRFTVFYDKDAYVSDGERNRFIAMGSFEHKYVNAAVQYLSASDQTSITKAKVDANGYSFWITPRSTMGLEGLFRYDNLKPNDDQDAHRKRLIAGIAYWLPHQGTVSSALMLDFEQVKSNGFTPNPPTQQRIALHTLVNF